MSTESTSSKNGKKKAVTAALARRLAEAADGYRNIGEVNFLARYEPDNDKFFDLSEGYPEQYQNSKHPNLREHDQKKVEKLGGEYDWFGPYDTKDSKVPKVVIKRIEVILEDPNEEGKEKIVVIETLPTDSEDPNKQPFDAMFWSLSALEKFAVPYYARLHGGKYADQVVTDFTADDFFLTAHRPGTEYGNPASPFLIGVRLDNSFVRGYVIEELDHGLRQQQQSEDPDGGS